MTVGPTRRQRSRVLHDGWGASRTPARAGVPTGTVPPVGPAAGVSLLEVLISMVIMMIGILAVLSLLVTARRDAESASDRAAIALAARQVLENHLAGWGPDLPSDQVVPVGVRRVRVTLVAESASAGLFRLRSRARDEASGGSWTLETLEVPP